MNQKYYVNSNNLAKFKDLISHRFSRKNILHENKFTLKVIRIIIDLYFNRSYLFGTCHNIIPIKFDVT